MTEEKISFGERYFPLTEDAIEKIRVSKGKEPLDSLDIRFLGTGIITWAKSLFFAGSLFYVGFQSIGNSINYSEGERVGVINKISDKGLPWKTKEGQLSLEGRTSTGEQTGAGVWDFSIDNQYKNGENIEKLYSKAQDSMKKGNRVKISYKQPLATWPWRSKTTYLIQDIEILED